MCVCGCGCVCTLHGKDMQRFGGLWAAEEYIKQQRAPLLFLTDSCWDYLAFRGWKLLQQGCQTLYTNYNGAKLLLYILISLLWWLMCVLVRVFVLARRRLYSLDGLRAVSLVASESRFVKLQKRRSKHANPTRIPNNFTIVSSWKF